MAILPNIVFLHAQEAAALWLIWERIIRAPHIVLADLLEMEDRIAANLEGLRLAGEEGLPLCRSLLELPGPAEVFACLSVGLILNHPGLTEEAVAIGSRNLRLSRGLAAALAWTPWQDSQRLVERLLSATSPWGRRAALAGLVAHRQPAGPIAALSRDHDPAVRSRALRALGELGAGDHYADLRAALGDPDEAARFWARWSMALLSTEKTAVQELLSLTDGPGPYQQRTVQLCLRMLPPETSLGLVQRWARQPQTRRLAILAAGVVGDSALVPWLIEQMREAEQARAAGESFCLITGVDLTQAGLAQEPPPAENPEAPSEDANLPVPRAEAVAAWWKQNQGRFTPGVRHLRGQPITVPACRDALKTGGQRQRAAAALELAILQPCRPLFEVRAPASRQLAILESDKL